MKGKKAAALVLSAALVFSGSGTALAAQTDEAQEYDGGGVDSGI